MTRPGIGMAHPDLMFVIDNTESRIQFGYRNGEEMALITQNGKRIYIPRDVMLMAAKDGWSNENDCPSCEAESRGKDD